LPTVALVCKFVLPEALSKIILARITIPTGRDRELAKLSSCTSSQEHIRGEPHPDVGFE
jgi:hypothetical protein